LCVDIAFIVTDEDDAVVLTVNIPVLEFIVAYEVPEITLQVTPV